MALKIFEANLENVNPALRGEYEKQPNGSYTLKLVDLDEFVHGLKSALRKERETIKDLRTKYSVTDDVPKHLRPLVRYRGRDEAARRRMYAADNCHDAGRRIVGRSEQTRRM